jgi:S-adenosyl-L-methionine hydrolase (adenosine-forming)
MSGHDAPHEPGRYDTVSFLSDYGTTDEFVGVVKSVIRSVAPHALVIDITHEIPPHDLRTGGLALVRSAQYLAPGVILAVVDPGVGTDRRGVAVEVAGGAGVFVGPDNGLLASAVAMTGGADRAVELTNPDYQLAAPGPTFAGRDVFAPAAAHLCNGVDLGDLGPAIDPITLRPGILPLSETTATGVKAEVLWIDRFGNVQLNVDPDDIAFLGDRLQVRFGESDRSVRTGGRVSTYGDLKQGQLGVIVDSYGLVSLALDRSSAAAELKLRPGDAVSLEVLS